MQILDLTAEWNIEKTQPNATKVCLIFVTYLSVPTADVVGCQFR